MADATATTWSSVRLAASQLYGVEPYDPRSVFLAAGGLVFVSAIGAYLAARRATQVDPMVALRYE